MNDVPQAPATNRKATWSLITGILSLFICPIILSIAALVLGSQAKNEIATTGESGEGLATAGQVLGAIGIIIGVVALVIVL